MLPASLVGSTVYPAFEVQRGVVPSEAFITLTVGVEAAVPSFAVRRTMENFAAASVDVPEQAKRIHLIRPCLAAVLKSARTVLVAPAKVTSPLGVIQII